MRLLKPSWVNHNGKPIFSLDIHPDGSRFATGGHSEDSCSGKVVIWNMAPVREEAVEYDTNVPKILCQMDHHLACVNCVRWSHSGKFLVSGGDDKLIMVWQAVKGAGSSTVFGTGGKVVNIEQWKCVSTLRGHSGDVLDLAWSPHDAWLASCSVDNTIVVWNTLNFPEQLATLRGHSGLVKGVTWDPVGKYIASQSDDKSMRVWRTLDWQQEAVIEKPFQECGGTTHVLRLDWSPDGSYIVSAHAMNNSGPTAQSVEREDWKISVDFVGHRKAITVVKFNNRIFSRKLEKEKTGEYTCCAIGSRDRSLSIWLTYLKRPLVVIHDLFDDSVMDISWNCKVAELLCCSWDGTVAFMDFESEEIGLPLSQSEMCSFHERVYGKSLSLSNGQNNAVIAESVDILHLQQNVPDWNEEKPKTTETPQGYVTPAKVKPQNKQIETITPDGRRRITPIMLSASPEVTDVPPPFNSTDIEFQTSTEPSKIIIEKVDCTSGSSKLTASPIKSTSSPLARPVSEIPAPQTAQASAVTGENKEALSTADNRETHAGQEKKDAEEAVKSMSLKAKRKLDTGTTAAKRPKKDKDTKAAATAIVQEPGAHPLPLVSPVTGTVLPAIKLLKSFTKQIKTSGGDSVSLDVENSVQAGAVTVHQLRCVTNGVTSWAQVFSSSILLVTGSSKLVAVACVDHSLTVMSERGTRLFPPIILSSRPALLEASGSHLVSISQSAHVHLWNVRTKSCMIKGESLSPILTDRGVTIQRASVTINGVVVVELSHGKSFTYNTDLSVWCLVSDRNDSLRQCIDQLTYPPGLASGTLSSLTKSPHKKLKSAARSLHGSNPDLQKTMTLSHLETQVTSCVTLRSAHEYRFWLLTYVRYLTQHNLELKLRVVFDDLLATGCDHPPHIMVTLIVYCCCCVKCDELVMLYFKGLDKRELMDELLHLLGSNLQLQRLYAEYRERLDARS